MSDRDTRQILVGILCLTVVAIMFGFALGIRTERDKYTTCTNPKPIIRLRASGPTPNFEVTQCDEGLRVVELDK